MVITFYLHLDDKERLMVLLPYQQGKGAERGEEINPQNGQIDVIRQPLAW